MTSRVRIRGFVLSLVQPARRDEVASILDRTWSRIGVYLRAKAIVMAIVGALMYVSLLDIGVPFAVPLAIVVAFGGQPIPWLTTSPINIFCEILILVWLQTGFAMVVLSAAIKGVPGELLEAGRLDGASERQVFTGIIIPMIRGSIITVATTIAIVTLKIFDIVYVTTGGRFNDDVVAVRMFHEIFQFFNDGRGAALATLPQEQRDVYLLHEESGLSLEEIARITGVGPETAKSRLRYAVGKLKAALAAAQDVT